MPKAIKNDDEHWQKGNLKTKIPLCSRLDVVVDHGEHHMQNLVTSAPCQCMAMFKIQIEIPQIPTKFIKLIFDIV